ncbi:AraC family transcriptional regulator [Paenibacillus chungangensis]|uniref:AraC family transcriptional regulator n=1 Tax=Paenibacillus chungangensis TaxID=696535 RepID=A0ABW3HTP7_9BACL
MNILQLRIPPLPQFITGGYAMWTPGTQHFERTFSVYDILLVCSGTLYMTEEGEPYEIGAGQLIILERNKMHVGHRPCTEPTEVYWIHFKHELPVNRIEEGKIDWTHRVTEGTDFDLQPREQYLYLPKHGSFDAAAIRPILDRMLELRKSLTMNRAMDLQVLLGQLLSQLQASMQRRGHDRRSYKVAEMVMRYLEERMTHSYHAEDMRRELHFHEDYAARCLRRHTGLSPLQYLQWIRVERAKQLLSHSQLPLQEIAEQVGYDDYNYFIRVFRKLTGQSPGAYRDSTLGYV